MAWNRLTGEINVIRVVGSIALALLVIFSLWMIFG